MRSPWTRARTTVQSPADAERDGANMKKLGRCRRRRAGEQLRLPRVRRRACCRRPRACRVRSVLSSEEGAPGDVAGGQAPEAAAPASANRSHWTGSNRLLACQPAAGP